MGGLSVGNARRADTNLEETRIPNASPVNAIPTDEAQSGIRISEFAIAHRKASQPKRHSVLSSPIWAVTFGPSGVGSRGMLAQERQDIRGLIAPGQSDNVNEVSANGEGIL